MTNTAIPAIPPWKSLLAVASGTFMATLDASIVNVALPTVSADLHSPLTDVQWAITAYLLTISSLLTLFGRLGDNQGKGRIYGLGFLLFTAASIMCGSAPGIWWLVAARTLQGVGAAMIMANGPAILMVTFPGTTRGRALGSLGAVVALGTMTGPGLGGYLVGAFGWRAIFYVNIPVGILGYLLAKAYLPNERAKELRRIDPLASALFACGVASLLLALTRGHDFGWTSPVILGGFTISVASLSLFFRRDRHSLHPALDMDLLSYWPFLSGLLAASMAFMAMFSNILLMPFYLHEVLGLPPTRVGLILSAMPLAMGMVAPFSGYLSERINHALLTTAGLCVSAVALIHNAMLTTTSPIFAPVLGQALLGIGFGLFQSPNNNSIMSTAPMDKSGLAGGLLALMRNLGMVSGAAAAVTIFEGFRGPLVTDVSLNAQHFMSGFRAALIFGAGVALTAAYLSFARKKRLESILDQ